MGSAKVILFIVQNAVFLFHMVINFLLIPASIGIHKFFTHLHLVSETIIVPHLTVVSFCIRILIHFLSTSFGPDPQ
jgi:hypothetical protein